MKFPGLCVAENIVDISEPSNRGLGNLVQQFLAVGGGLDVSGQDWRNPLESRRGWLAKAFAWDGGGVVDVG